MKTPLACLNLLHGKMRTLVAIAGVAFSVLLIFMQLGFLGSVRQTSTAIFDALDFHIMIRSPGYLHVGDARQFPRTRLYQASASPAVESVMPFHVELNQWRNPLDGRRRGILVMGVDPSRPPFRLDELARKSRLLHTDEALLVDRESRPEFGPRNERRFSNDDVGVRAEVGNKQVRIIGHFGLATGLTADGAVLLNQQGFCRLFPGRDQSRVNLGLVRVADAANIDQVADQLRRSLPPDVEVLTRQDALDFELDRWVNQTSIGLIFRLGVVVAFIVGTAIVYQVLTTDVAKHLKEYATLKAIGYGNGYLVAVVLTQAALLAICGFVPGVLLAEILYRVTTLISNVPVEMNPQRLATVLGLALAMCTLSGFIASRRVRTADPAELF